MEIMENNGEINRERKMHDEAMFGAYDKDDSGDEDYIEQ